MRAVVGGVDGRDGSDLFIYVGDQVGLDVMACESGGIQS